MLALSNTKGKKIPGRLSSAALTSTAAPGKENHYSHYSLLVLFVWFIGFSERMVTSSDSDLPHCKIFCTLRYAGTCNTLPSAIPWRLNHVSIYDTLVSMILWYLILSVLPILVLPILPALPILPVS